MRRLSFTDMALLGRESPRQPNHCGVVILCEGRSGEPVTFDRVLDWVGQRIHKDSRLLQRPMRQPHDAQRPVWAVDPKFDVRSHVRAHTLAPPGNWTQFCEEISRIMSPQLDLRRPPWELHFIEGLTSVPRVGPNGFAVVAKVHHIGVSKRRGMNLLNLLTSIDAKAFDCMPRRPESAPALMVIPASQRNPNRLPRHPSATPMRHGVADGLQGPGSTAGSRHQDHTAGQASPTRFSRIAGPQRFAYAVFVPLAKIKVICHRVANVTTNDVVLAVIGGALRRYLDAHRELPQHSLIAASSVPWHDTGRTALGGGGTERTGVAVRTDIADDFQRLTAISSASPKPAELRTDDEDLAELSESAPGQVVGTCLRRTAESAVQREEEAVADTTVIHVPGPRVPLYFLGSKVCANYGVGTIHDGSGPVHLAATYCDSLTISVLSDRETMPDIGLYVNFLREAFASLHGTAVSGTTVGATGLR